MQKKKFAVLSALSTIVFTLLIYSTASAASYQKTVLKKGSTGSAVTALQKDLKTLGMFTENPTGYFGPVTETAIKKVQRLKGLSTDGIAGKSTYDAINGLLAKKKTTAQKTTSKNQKTNTLAARSDTDREGYMIPWFDGVENIFSIGTTATVYDIETGLSFRIKRTYGYNHADCETLTAEDTKIMKKIYSGTWSWSRRAIIVTVGERKIAASMAGMPHAGVDDEAANAYVQDRSEGYGAGTNLDTVKGNDMDGHFDIHFLGSKTHGTNKVDSQHQEMVKKAGGWALKNL